MTHQKTKQLFHVNELFLKEEQKAVEYFQNTVKKINEEDLELISVSEIEFRILLFSNDDSFNSNQSVDEGVYFYECKVVGKDLIEKLQGLSEQEHCRTMNYVMKQTDFDTSWISKIDEVWIELMLDIKLKTKVWTNKYEPYLIKG